MNTALSPAGLPAYFAHTSGHSVSNHPPVRPRLSVVHCFSQHADLVPLADLASGRGPSRSGGLGYGTDFAQRSQARPTVWPNRVHVVSSLDSFVTDWQFTSGSSPPRVATTQ